MGGEPQRVAVADRIDLRLVSGTADERVVGRHGAVVIQAQHFARIAVRILRAAAVPAARRRHIELAVASPRDPRRAADARAAAEDVREIGDRGAVEAAASHRQRRLSLGADRLQVREVDEAVGGKLRMEQHVQQPRSALDAHGGDAGNGLWIEHAVADDPEAPFFLRDEQAFRPAETPGSTDSPGRARPARRGSASLRRCRIQSPRRESAAARIQPARLAHRSRTEPSVERCRCSASRETCAGNAQPDDRCAPAAP